MAFLSGLEGILNSPRAQGISDLVGRFGNGMAATQGQPQNYSPAQPGLAGIGTSLQQIQGAPLKTSSTARPVTGGGRIPGIGPGTPAQGMPMPPMMSPGGYPNGSGVPY
jgi:hypothetical protein